MHGNVWEWTVSPNTNGYAHRGDKVTIDSAAVPSGGPDSVPEGSKRVMRGGCYLRDADRMRSAYRNPRSPEADHEDYGFRVLIPGVSPPV